MPCKEVMIKVRQHLRLLLLVGCGQVCLSSDSLKDSLINNKSIERTNSYLWFLHGENHEGKVASKTTTFVWLWPGVPLVQLDSMILWLWISLERINWSFVWSLPFYLSLLFIFFNLLSNLAQVHAVMACSIIFISSLSRLKGPRMARYWGFSLHFCKITNPKSGKIFVLKIEQ